MIQILVQSRLNFTFSFGLIRRLINIWFCLLCRASLEVHYTMRDGRVM